MNGYMYWYYMYMNITCGILYCDTLYKSIIPYSIKACTI